MSTPLNIDQIIDSQKLNIRTPLNIDQIIDSEKSTKYKYSHTL